MPDWSLLQTPNFAGALMGGLQAGRQMRRENEREGALAGYLANPEDGVSITRLAAADPELGLPLMERQRKARENERVGELRRLAAGGDANAAAQLWADDPDFASRLDERSQKQLKSGMDALGNAAYEVALLPEAERAAAWDQRVDYLSRQFPGVAQYKGQYSPDNLNGLLAQTGMTEKVLQAQKPSYQVNPTGGTVLQTNANARGGFGVVTMGGGDPVSSGPQPGSVENGYRFRGGDPADPASWEKLGGPTPTASGTFPG